MIETSSDDDAGVENDESASAPTGKRLTVEITSAPSRKRARKAYNTSDEEDEDRDPGWVT